MAAGADPFGDFRDLADPERRREVERRGEFFVVEGVLALEALVASPYRIRTVLAAARRADEVRALVGDRAPVAVRSDAEVVDIAGFTFHRGVLASADRRAPPEPGTLLRAGGTVVVTEGLNDHENLGALFRNAAAFGAAAVLLDPTTADPLYRRSVRVSLGHVLRVPWSRTEPLPAGLGLLRDHGFTVVALTPAPAAEPLRSMVWPERVALVVGSEGPGLTAGTLAAADRRVRIPLAPGIDSLNVATAAAVVLYAKGAPWGA